MTQPAFMRPHHRRIALALRELDSDLLDEAQCYFGGGTAIVLALGEYRESVDIDFLCGSTDGYRLLVNRANRYGLDGLLRKPGSLKTGREPRTDRYGIRMVLEVDEAPIRFEIVREARISLSGAPHVGLGVPMLLREDLYAEKLLANADRWADTSTFARDLIDLTMMISRWGPIPEAAWMKARTAYGEMVDRGYQRSVAALREPGRLERCLDALRMSPELAGEILEPIGGSVTPLPDHDNVRGWDSGRFGLD